MNYNTVVLLSGSIFIAAIIGAVKFSRVPATYHPIIICTWVGSLNEVIGMILSRSGAGIAFSNNIYMLAEALLLCWQFKRWGLMGISNRVYPVLIGGLLLGWWMEWLAIPRQAYLFYFSIAYCLVVVVFAVRSIAGQVVSEAGSLLRNSRFLLCGGFIIYFTFRILIEAFWETGLYYSSTYRNEVFVTITWINLLVNIINSFAFLCIPRKPRFIST